MPLEVKCSGKFDMNVEGVSYPATFIVAEINIPGIIGLDIVSDCNCEIKMKPCSIVVDGRFINCELKENIGCYGKMSEYPGVSCSYGHVNISGLQKPTKTNTNHDQMANCQICVDTFVEFTRKKLRHPLQV